MATLAQGTTITFTPAGGSQQTFLATRVSVNRGSGAGSNRQRISTAYLGSDPNKEEPFLEIWQPRADEGGGQTVDVDFISATLPTAGASGTLAITGKISFNNTATTVVSSVVTAAVGDIVRGSASFRFPFGA